MAYSSRQSALAAMKRIHKRALSDYKKVKRASSKSANTSRVERVLEGLDDLSTAASVARLTADEWGRGGYGSGDSFMEISADIDALSDNARAKTIEWLSHKWDPDFVLLDRWQRPIDWLL